MENNNGFRSIESGGLVGVYTHNGLSAPYEALKAQSTLQQRGDGSAHIVSINNNDTALDGGKGKIEIAYTKSEILKRASTIAIGFNAHAESNELGRHFHSSDGRIAFIYDGSLRKYNGDEVADLIRFLLDKGAGMSEAIAEVQHNIPGAYSAILVDQKLKTLAGFTDLKGAKPLAVGIDQQTGRSVISSETCTFSQLEISKPHVRELGAGEQVIINNNGVDQFTLWTGQKREFDPLEIALKLNLASHFEGIPVRSIREQLGIMLASKYHPYGDLVTGIPDNAFTIAMSYAAASGLPYQQAITTNRYLAGTMPEIVAGADIRFNVMDELVKNKEVVVIDDLIVRGGTFIGINKRLKSASVKEVNLGVAFPQYINPSETDIRVKSQDDLLSAQYSPEGIRSRLDLGSIHFLSLEGFLSVLGESAQHINTRPFQA